MQTGVLHIIDTVLGYPVLDLYDSISDNDLLL